LARSRKVDSGTAIETVVKMFAETGYSGISTREIETQSGVTRFMLQTEYGGKKALYLTALDKYLDGFEMWLNGTAAGGGLPELANFFRGRCDDQVMTKMGRFGCFMITTTSEFGDTDPEISTRTDRYFQMFRAAFNKALTTARVSGQIKADLDIAAETEILIAGIIGLNAYIRAMGSNTAGEEMAKALAGRIEALAA
jgi:TetR/AcrR family transcriptional repressor of nem operon